MAGELSFKDLMKEINVDSEDEEDEDDEDDEEVGVKGQSKEDSNIRILVPVARFILF